MKREPEDDFYFDDIDEENPEGKTTKRRFRINLNIILLAIILALVSVIAYRLIRWNIGTRSDYDPEEVNTNFDVEVQDVIIPLAPSNLEGREDDGKTTILCLGNNPFSDDLTETGLAGQIASLSGADVIAAPFPNSRVASYNAIYDPSTEQGMDDVFNLYYVCNSINTGDFEAMSNVASFKEDSVYSSSVNILQNVDFDDIDIIAIMYDAIDYTTLSPVDNLNDENDIMTYTGALKRSLELIQEAYPHIRIVFLSPTFAHSVDADGNYQNGDTVDLGNGAIPTYWVRAIDICTAAGVSFIDNYYGSINENNYKTYMTDYVHLNEAGRKQIAEHFVNKIIDNDHSEYNVSAADQATEAESGDSASAEGEGE
ncbi:MAG: SGNH/GDSL hydrolase family protein [Eubacteriales bacterium]|nr:SGNH/GDSL hydrolase family protein [Eubacteriales bacterium]